LLGRRATPGWSSAIVLGEQLLLLLLLHGLNRVVRPVMLVLLSMCDFHRRR